MKRSALPACLLLFAVVTFATAADPPETFQERLEYDAESGEWIETAAPIPGTEEGDLALARSLVAREEFKAARKAMAAWFKTWPESAHWPEALFYAAENEVSAEDAKPKSGDLIKAYGWLEELLDGWPGTELSDRAIRKELIIAEMLLFKERKQKVWKGVLWLSGEEEALTMLDRIIDDRARDTPVAEQALRLKADYHYVNGDFEEAEEAYARLMRDFARGRYSKFALLRAGESALARFPGVDFDDADLLEAEVYLKDYRQKYPEEAGEYMVPQLLSRIEESRAEKDFRVAQYYRRVGQIDAAVYYYRMIERDWSATTWGGLAHQQLIELGAIEPEVSADAVSVVDEAPAAESQDD
ncbi:MAG: outer membrane protein assembly factor BamD [Planctomycetia bacterium]|jgi:outer membrane protein assembly factor BamD (BamD/ComL family)|nr:outer membrane protein assembly factor BamD [Planctomycetia bacterium]MCC7315841.1 outer membrane protein assembly factor BamD [Planctomycetota bacterium]